MTAPPSTRPAPTLAATARDGGDEVALRKSLARWLVSSDRRRKERRAGDGPRATTQPDGPQTSDMGDT